MRVTRKSVWWIVAGICVVVVSALVIWPRVESHWPGGTAGSALYAARLSVDYACHPHRDVGTSSPPEADVSFVGGEKVEKVSPTPPGIDAWRIEGYVLLRRWDGRGQTVPYACDAVWRPDGRYLIDHLDLNGMGYGLAAVLP